MIEEVAESALRLQREAVKAIERHRFDRFEFSHAEGFVNAVREMKALEGQSDEAFQLYRSSLLIHYDTLTSLTPTIQPFESAFLEWMQTPVAFQRLMELDSSFKESVEILAKTVDENDEIISLEAMRLANGFYGVTSAKDFAAIPGSTLSVLAKVVEWAGIDREHAKTILAAKSWGLLTSYVFGDTFLRIFKETGDINRAVSAEKRAMKEMLLQPVETQVNIMRSFGFSSFDPVEYYRRYTEKFTPFIDSAFREGVHPANIVVLPTHVGDVGHHIGWQYYSICRDEMNMEVLRVHYSLLENNIRRAIEGGHVKSIFDLSTLFTGISAAYIYRLLSDEGFTANMLTRLFTERFYHSIMARQFERYMVNELHVNDFLDFASRGEKIGRAGWKVKGYEIDFTPLANSRMLNSGEMYAFPFCVTSTKFASLMKFIDMPCLLAPEPPSITVMVNAIAMNPEKAFAPVNLCKGCATAEIQPNRCLLCKAQSVI
ncbi:Uncharacterized protein conserved in archaea [Geoglobus ahangari]|uniref:Uncharacterized protein conserved in archaea n=1 Tax=Geoglobus ahangari TaxID=113653 RepID=A0A0F7IDF3_9EURY|nr:DUF2193 family protein [Geoglobus ahangari]AKG91452.1 Uncharacterized protein conserved in archaea [Geoglobus ahangari]